MQNQDAYSAGLVLALFEIVMIPILVIGLIVIISYWKIYSKAGKPGWASIIPVYNVIVMLEIIGKPIWWFILFLLPGVNIVFLIWTTNLLSKSFGRGEGFTIGLLFLPFIFFPLLAFSNYNYMGPAGANLSGFDPSLNYQNPA